MSFRILFATLALSPCNSVPSCSHILGPGFPGQQVGWNQEVLLHFCRSVPIGNAKTCSREIGALKSTGSCLTKGELVKCCPSVFGTAGPTPRTSPWRARAHPPSLQRPTCAPHIPAHGARVNWGVTSVTFENAATDPTRERRNAHSGANRSD